MALLFFAFENPYGTAAGIGAGFFAISYLAAKKATKEPNDNLYWLLFGANYVNVQQYEIDKKNQTSFWQHPIDYVSGVAAEKGGIQAKPLFDKQGKPYYRIAGKDYTPQELFMSLHAANGVPLRPVNWPPDLNVDDSRKSIGNLRPSANDPTFLVQDPTLARQIPSFYPTPTGKGPTKENAALSLSEQTYVDTHRAIFQQVYGTKELSSFDVQQVWVAYYHATKPDTRQGGHEKAWVNTEDWINKTKGKESQDAYDAELRKRAEKWAQQVGTGDPVADFKDTPKQSTPSVAQVTTTAIKTGGNPGVSLLMNFFGKTKGTTSTQTPTGRSQPVISKPSNQVQPKRPPTRGRGW